MTRIIFTIRGNHKSPIGNAVPKLKMTGNQHWTKKAQEYVQWKEHVVYALLETMKSLYPDLEKQFCKNIIDCGKPIVLAADEVAHMALAINWKDETHCDPENCFGSIADALFHNDKHLDGKFESQHSRFKKGHVEVDILIYKNQKS